MSYFIKCGKRVDPEDTYCTKCGASLELKEVHLTPDWFRGVAEEITSRKDRMSKRDGVKYKLDLLLRISKRVDVFSVNCTKCQSIKGEITKLTKDFSDTLSSKNKRSGYLYAVDVFTKHLQISHKLISQQRNLMIWSLIGAVVGSIIGGTVKEVLGVSMAISSGLIIGGIIGGAIGFLLDERAKSKGRVI